MPKKRHSAAQIIHKLREAELPKLVSAIDALTCPWCGGQRKLIALPTDGLIVRLILEHLNLPTEPRPLAPARAPPEPAFAWWTGARPQRRCPTQTASREPACLPGLRHDSNPGRHPVSAPP